METKKNDKKKIVKILIVDDQASVRTSLKLQFQYEQNFQVVGEAREGREALAAAKALQPDIILMDLDMPGVDGLTATSQMSTVCPDCKIIILSIHDDPQIQSKAKEVGAAAFVTKRDVDTLLLEVNNQVADYFQ